MPAHLHPGPATPAVAARLAAWRAAGVARRLVAGDATLWTDAGIADTPGDPIAGRLGWVDLPEASRAALGDYGALAETAAAEGVRHVVLLGMGGSSLGAEVLARCAAAPPGGPWPDLVVADSTHPAFVRALDARVDARRAWFVAASKSGTTVETTAHLAHAVARLSGAVDAPWRHVVVVTDPGTPLAAEGHAHGCRAVVDGRPDVGGRFSVLSAFGLLPAALCGVDVGAVLDGAARARSALAAGGGATGPALDAGRDVPGSAWHDESGVALGAALGEWAAAGRTTLSLVAAPRAAALPGWIEQLVAESLGKAGRGIFVRTLAAVPSLGELRPDEAVVVIEAGAAPDAVAAGAAAGEAVAAGAASAIDRADALAAAGAPVVRERFAGPADLGALLFRWEVATALAATVLGVQPFDQPDVEAAKRLARAAMAGGGSERGDAAATGDVAPAAAFAATGAAATASAPTAIAAPAADVADVLRAAAVWLDGLPPGALLAVQAYLPPSAAADAALAALAGRLAARTGAAVAVGYGPRYLHSTGQLHKGGLPAVRCLQIVDAALTAALAPPDGVPGDVAVPGAGFSFGQLCAAQAAGDAAALRAVGRPPCVVSVARLP